MGRIKEVYTIAELAPILSLTERAIRYQSVNENWPTLEGQGINCGKAFPFRSLPEHRKQLIIAHALNTLPKHLDGVEIPLERLEEIMSAFDALEQGLKDEALAKFEILEACRNYIKTHFMKNSKGRKGFAALYNKKVAPGIEDKTYGLIKVCSLRSLYRWEQQFKVRWLLGLAADNAYKGRPKSIVTDLSLIVNAALAKTPHISDSKLYEILVVCMPKGIKPPHRTTVLRWKKAWLKKHGEAHLLAKDPKAWKHKYLPAMGSFMNAPHAGHTWEMDSTPSDILTSDGKRCVIIGAIDRGTRCLVITVAETSNSEAVAACFRKLCLIWGKPECVVMDNGRDYKSKHIQAIMDALDIDTPKLPVNAPEKKPYIERVFGTLTRELEEMLPLYLGHTVEQRAALRERQVWAKRILEKPVNNKAVEIPLTRDEFLEVIEKWLEYYHNRPHSGFNNDPGRQNKGLTPMQAFERSTVKPRVFRDESVLHILLSKVGTYTVHKTGIRVKDGCYMAPELVDYIGHRVTVRWDAEDAGTLYVFDEDGKFICLALDEALKGERLADYLERRSRKLKRQRMAWRAAQTLSDCMDISYTHNLMTGKIYDTFAVADEPSEVKEFRPAFDNESVRAAQEAVAAKEGRPKRKGSGSSGVLKMEPRYIYPKAQSQEPVSPYPKGVTDEALYFFEFLVKKNEREGLTEWEKERIFFCYDNYREVQIFHTRPLESQIKIIAPQPSSPTVAEVMI
jgi:transposase InsO family protein